jgi:hypothetical protein
MDWQKRVTGEKQDVLVDSESAAAYEQAKAEKLPVIEREATGVRPFEQLKFQPVTAHGFFDAEFAEKGEDIVFHFWPYGFHKAQRSGSKSPAFPKDFQEKLRKAMRKSFADNRVVVDEDKDMGSFFVKAVGYTKALSPFKLATDVCKELYVLMGGEIES